jgi:Ni,Fe-hydrogenase III small subunit
MIKLYRLNTGSCGGCDIEIDLAVRGTADLSWAATPQEAHALLLTGPITAGSGGSLLALVRELGEPPLLAVGRCAIDGQPFGAGGVEALSSLVVRLRVEGCPVTPAAVAAAIREALHIEN